ncbi:MAG: SiaB family protein kinase [Bacteroidales bacterium]|nr:SiaB family protein kinase [Bacteroidales bacterium]
MKTKFTSFQELVYAFHESIQPLDVKLMYEGEINHDIMKVFTTLTENDLKSEEFPGQKKVFNVMVECLQNISKHADCVKGSKQENIGNGIFLIANNVLKLTIVTGNIIVKEKEKFIKEKIDYINQLNKEELREYYKKMLKENTISNLGGAGLGFIDIARKTQNKLHYSFNEIDDKYSFFIMTATISK